MEFIPPPPFPPGRQTIVRSDVWRMVRMVSIGNKTPSSNRESLELLDQDGVLGYNAFSLGSRNATLQPTLSAIHFEFNSVARS